MPKTPPPEHLRSTQCDGKHRFDSMPLAKKVASKQNQRKDTQISAYRCGFCNGWHVGQHIKKSRNKK